LSRLVHEIIILIVKDTLSYRQRSKLFAY